MQTFDEKLKALLKTEPSFLDKDWELLEWKLQDSARNADEKLIKLLITNEETKSKFFSEIVWYQVFNGNLFIEYISNKNFLDNSYTKYKNKIWLRTNGKFLKGNGDVQLVRPFKDCVLEWWQSKEDEKKKEIFFNEILAQDEIDKLFAPKVLTNFKKYDKDWEHKVERFKRDENGTIKDNLIIKWNNLLALHTLKKEFEQQVKCIYIDVPYNTWSDSFWYNDKFNHSTWLTFMKNRLEIAKNLLKQDWSIFVQCDVNEQSYLKVLMDEIFWRDNHLSTITVKVKAPAWVWQESFLFDVNEYILAYSKNLISLNINVLKDKSELNENTYKQYNKILKIKNNCKKIATLHSERNWDIDLMAYNDYEVVNIKKEEKEESFYRDNLKTIFRTTNPQWWLMKKILPNIPKEWLYSISYIPSKWAQKDGITYYFLNWALVVRLNDSAVIEDNKLLKLSKMTNLWDDHFFQWISDEWNVVLKAGKKPEALIERILNMWTNSGDIVLDYHLWSWTTAAVAHKLGRQYIWIEQLDYQENDSVVRLRNVIEWDTTWISKSVNWQWWWEFIYCELKKYNQEFIEQIETAKNTDELLKIRENMKEKAYFKYNFDMQKFEENMDYFKNWTNSLKEQKELLVEVLNKNQLYVNLSDIDDENFEVSDEDKKLNNLFYEIW